MNDDAAVNAVMIAPADSEGAVMTTPTLYPIDRRIADVLTCAVDAIDPGALEQLIGEVEGAIASSTDVEAAERARLLDPSIVLDTNKAQATLQAIELRRSRLRAALPRLRKRFREAEDLARARWWDAQYLTVKAEREKLVSEFVDVALPAIKQLADLFDRIEKFDRDRLG